MAALICWIVGHRWVQRFELGKRPFGYLEGHSFPQCYRCGRRG